MQTLLIIPTYNERENLQRLAQDIFSYLPRTHILIIDDNSPDGTGRLADHLAQRDKRIQVIHRGRKLGLGSAYLAGFTYALGNSYDFVLAMDGDFSHQPRYLPQLLAQASGNNLVVGSRYVPGGQTTGWETWRKLLSYGGNLYAKVVLGLPYHDLTSGFKCYSPAVLRSLQLDQIISEGYVFQIETTYRAHCRGYAIKEIPIIFHGRRKGASKISRRICVEAIWKVPLLRLKIGRRASA